MSRVVITGAGVLSCVADSPAGLHAALCEGKSGLKPIKLFSTEGLGCHQAGEIRPFEPRDYLGERNLRPIDRTSRLLLVAAQQALESSGWTAERRKEQEIGLVLGTVFCSVRTIAEFDRRGLQLGPSYASPLDFANSVINAAAGQAAIWHDLRGINTTITGGEASSLLALAYATDLIRDGRAGALVASGAEELCFESFLGHERAGRLGGRPVPFDTRRDGFALAEGAGALMLEEAEGAAARGARILASIRGHGQSFDPAVGEDESSTAAAVARAVRLALEDAGDGRGGVGVRRGDEDALRRDAGRLRRQLLGGVGDLARDHAAVDDHERELRLAVVEHEAAGVQLVVDLRRGGRVPVADDRLAERRRDVARRRAGAELALGLRRGRQEAENENESHHGRLLSPSLTRSLPGLLRPMEKSRPSGEPGGAT